MLIWCNVLQLPTQPVGELDRPQHQPVHARPSRAAAKRFVPDQLRRLVGGVLCLCWAMMKANGSPVMGGVWRDVYIISGNEWEYGTLARMAPPQNRPGTASATSQFFSPSH